MESQSNIKDSGVTLDGAKKHNYTLSNENLIGNYMPAKPRIPTKPIKSYRLLKEKYR